MPLHFFSEIPSECIPGRCDQGQNDKLFPFFPAVFKDEPRCRNRTCSDDQQPELFCCFVDFHECFLVHGHGCYSVEIFGSFQNDFSFWPDDLVVFKTTIGLQSLAVQDSLLAGDGDGTIGPNAVRIFSPNQVFGF